jgi:uncharacterized protein involved in exopolysaccharide biosynthesis
MKKCASRFTASGTGAGWRWVSPGWSALSGGIVAMVPNSYESKARIFVQTDDVLSDQIGVGNDGKRDIERVRQTLTSSVNLEKVIRATRLGDKITSDKQMERRSRAWARGSRWSASRTTCSRFRPAPVAAAIPTCRTPSWRRTSCRR